MKPFLVVIIVILSVNGVRADEDIGQNDRGMAEKLLDSSRSACAKKVGKTEADVKEFEERYKSNSLIASDPDKYGAYVGCLMNSWKMFEKNGQVNRKTFAKLAKKLKKEEEKEKFKSMEERFTNLLEGTTSLADSGSRCIAEKMKQQNNNT